MTLSAWDLGVYLPGDRVVEAYIAAHAAERASCRSLSPRRNHFGGKLGNCDGLDESVHRHRAVLRGANQ
jgi:hypothetical protein